MPAVSVCDPLAVALRHNLDAAGQSKSSDDLSIGLAGSTSRILCTELDYEETDFKQTVQDRLKSKYMVLSLPKQENADSGGKSSKDAPSSSKSIEKSKEPRLPEPTVVLYSPDKVTLGWNKSFPVGAGMYNVGNTCYLNSTLQALFHVPALVNWLMSDPHHESKCEQNDGGGECLTCAVAKTLQFSHMKNGEAIKPFHVYNKLKLICRTMVPGQQEDAHEFLRYLLEGMEKAYLARHKAMKLDNYSKETTPINQIFGGYIRTEVKCLQCRHVSTTFQHFQDLLLDIRKVGTLDEALAGYFSQEQLDNNDYKCEACKRRVPATKQFILERPPKVLCVQLKRFSMVGGKISRHIGFKPTVDMGPYIRRKPGEPVSKVIYRLASLVTHMGPSVNCGHYTAIAQVSSGKFYSFDDSHVRPIGLSGVVSTNAYIMIFEMEPSSSGNGQPQSSQLDNSKGEISLSKSSTSGLSFPYSNGMSSKLLDGSGLSRTLTPSKNTDVGSSKLKDRDLYRGASSTPPRKEIFNRIPSTPPRRDRDIYISSRLTLTPPPPPPISLSTLSRLNGSSSVRRSIIGPQLPSYLERNRPYESSKSGKLVDYDGDSSEDDEKNGYNNGCNSKKFRDEQEPLKPSNGSVSSKPDKPNGNAYAYDGPRRAISRSPSRQNGNGAAHYSHNNGSNAASTNNGETSVRGSSSNSNSNSNSSSNGSNGSCSRGSSPKNGSSNGRTEHNDKLEQNGSYDKVKEKWHYSKARTDSPDRKIYTKASTSLNKGWHVSKDSQPPPVATPNGWLVSENLSDETNNSSSRSNNHSMTLNAADVRYFNGNNRSDTVAQLQKGTLLAYGNSNVHSWNGGKARLDREVDSERRQGRKRLYDNNDDDELDRGRIKKVKMHHNDYKNRNETKYNRFQEQHNNNNKWRQHLNNNYYRHNNGQSYQRPRHGGGGGNYNRSNHNRYNHHNKPRNHWRR